MHGAPCIPDSDPHRITSTKFRKNAVVSPDDGHIVARNIQRLINTLRINCAPSWFYLQVSVEDSVFSKEAKHFWMLVLILNTLLCCPVKLIYNFCFKSCPKILSNNKSTKSTHRYVTCWLCCFTAHLYLHLQELCLVFGQAHF